MKIKALWSLAIKKLVMAQCPILIKKKIGRELDQPALSYRLDWPDENYTIIKSVMKKACNSLAE